MIYQTTLKSLNPPRGTNGEQLQFIGNFPCKVGDTVWTDGNVIFGHRPIRSTPILPVNDEVIPVIYYTDEGNGYRGYYTQSGKWKDYPVLGNSIAELPEVFYIVNGKNKLYVVSYTVPYGEELLPILDAEVDDDGNLCTVTEGFWSLTTESVPVKIFKNGNLFQEIELAQFMNLIPVKCTEQINEMYNEGCALAAAYIQPDGSWWMLLEIIREGAYAEVKVGENILSLWAVDNGLIAVTSESEVKILAEIHAKEELITVSPFSTHIDGEKSFDSFTFPIQEGTFKNTIHEEYWNDDWFYANIFECAWSDFEVFDKNGVKVCDINLARLLAELAPHESLNTAIFYPQALIKLTEKEYLLKLLEGSLFRVTDNNLSLLGVTFNTRLREMKKISKSKKPIII